MERNLIFVGFFGIIDPPRPEVRQAILTCREAGIRPVMITGDHPATARSIAEDLHIADKAKSVEGRELERMSDQELLKVAEETSVFARVSPEHKLRIVKALQQRGNVVAMTGDGVNDAPALRRADIGVAMGITGTDVSREAAHMVLLDDNFTTIVSAVEEGRTIFENIRKFVKYSVAGNLGKILVVLLAPLLLMPLPLTPLQILWLNLLTDGLLGLGLSVEPSEPGIMTRKPIPKSAPFFSGKLLRQIVVVGALIGGVSLGYGYWAWSTQKTNWQTIIFTTIATAQVWQALAVRTNVQSLFKVGLRSNRPLLGAVLLVLILQALVVYVPAMQGVFGTKPLDAVDLGMSVLLGSSVFLLIEARKWHVRRTTAKDHAS
jgi:Ca2+-transporting ATPase